MNTSKEVHVSEAKKAKVVELAELMKKKTVMVISIKGLPSAQFQDIKKKLRSKASVKVAKKSLVEHALNVSGVQGLHDLIPYIDDSTAMLFSNEDAFVISGILADEKSPTKAKAGQIAPFDIEVKAGPTELLPGPDISALSAVGLAPKVENGKIAVMQDKVILKEGKKVTEAIASIMAKLDIIPFEVGVEPIAAYMNDVVYVDIKIDREKAVEDLEHDFGRAFAFAVDLGIVNNETLDLILNKAGIDGLVIEGLISEKTSKKKVEEEAKDTEEVKTSEEKE